MTTFNYTSGDPSNLVGGQAADMSDISGPFSDLTTFLNGNISDVNIASNGVDNDNLDATSVASKVGLSQTGTVRRGKCIIATEESRTNTAYGTMTTADQVQNLVLPTDGLIFVAYQANWKNSVTLTGRAAIFLGSNQVKIATGTASTPETAGSEAVGPSPTNTYNPVFSYGGGLWCTSDTQAYPGDATTGQLLGANVDGASSGFQGGVASIFAAAGTYDVSVRFKSSSGSVTVKERKLWVWTMGF